MWEKLRRKFLTAKRSPLFIKGKTKRRNERFNTYSECYKLDWINVFVDTYAFIFKGLKGFYGFFTTDDDEFGGDLSQHVSSVAFYELFLILIFRRYLTVLLKKTLVHQLVDSIYFRNSEQYKNYWKLLSLYLKHDFFLWW